MKLSEAKKGDRLRFESFAGQFQYKSILAGVGLTEGDRILVIASSFLGSPITIQLENGELFGLRKNEAAKINVKKQEG